MRKKSAATQSPISTCDMSTILPMKTDFTLRHKTPCLANQASCRWVLPMPWPEQLKAAAALWALLAMAFIQESAVKSPYWKGIRKNLTNSSVVSEDWLDDLAVSNAYTDQESKDDHNEHAFWIHMIHLSAFLLLANLVQRLRVGCEKWRGF